MSYKPFSKPNKNLKDYCHNINTFEKRLKGLKENIFLIKNNKRLTHTYKANTSREKLTTYLILMTAYGVNSESELELN